MIRKVIFLFFFLTISLYGESDKPMPLENPYLRTDMNANFKNITNINNLVFYQNGSNLIVNLSTFLGVLSGEVTKLIDANDSSSYLYVSNGNPYLLKSGQVKKIILETDNIFIRQYDPLGIVSNMTVIQELKIQYPSSIDDSDYSVTYDALTNGAITFLRIGRYDLRDMGGILVASNIQNNVTTQLAP